MGKHYYSTCILLHLVVLLGFGFRLLEKHAVSHADTERIFTSDLNETTLAFGGRILLSTAGIYELE
ncbi:MAG: hypothetical protein KDD42_04635, partial [Bdellovibrionales bacterium]|nr:hypothetical protein [Bdellovibrionales bacterium]